MQTTNFQDVLSHMILSASGWRGIFAESGNEEDSTTKITKAHTIISYYMAASYADFITKTTGKNSPRIAVGIDARPTGPAIADAMMRVLIAKGITVEYLGITAAPEIMAYSHDVDGFVYISASHNPIGHNGVKFGKNDGGVIPGSENTVVTALFKDLCNKPDAEEIAETLAQKCSNEQIKAVYDSSSEAKKRAVKAYFNFSKIVITGEESESSQNKIFNAIKESVKVKPLSIVCDMNGSARTLSIDNDFITGTDIGFYAINNKPGEIVHAIIPEPENLVYVAEEMTALREGKGKSASKVHKDVALGYMPDCDGDRGNIVFWNEKTNKPEVLKAQEVFAISVMSELAYLTYIGKAGNGQKVAVSANDPTSMRIEEIVSAFGGIVGRAEVGEANVVNRARELRSEGYEVRILGEGSNGGNITHPAAVRDPLNTIFALVKLLVLRDIKDSNDVITKKGLFHLWCTLSNQENAYKDDFTLADVMETLPVYISTGVTEKRALLKIKTTDHSALKAAYKNQLISAWEKDKDTFKTKYGITSWEAISNNGTKETRNLEDFSLSARGGLKILFKNNENKPIAYVWMRGSGTEPVFRVAADVKGNNPEMEKELLAWHSDLISKADNSL